jgi:peptidoglycan/xylan/chitin deacetylase (PgdA/CDA1 family)
VILSYHRITRYELDPWGLRVAPENFAEHLAALREFAEPATLLDLIPGGPAPKTSRPRFAITFDDGYLDNLSNAGPLLEKFETPATIFVPTSFIGARLFWWDALEMIFLRPNELPPHLALEVAGREVSWTLGEAALYTDKQYAADCAWRKWRGEPGTRLGLYHEIYDAVWKMSSAEKESALEHMRAWSGLPLSELTEARPMDAGELAAVSSSGLISIGGHSIHHLPLDEMPEESQEIEIAGCRAHLEDLLSLSVETFAYPHGKYTETTKYALARAGYRAACTTRSATISQSEDPLTLPRVSVTNWSGEEFVRQLETRLNA